jgi:hypothetical protein
VKYIIIHSNSIVQMETLVNAQLESGFELRGDLIADEGCYSQVMTKPTKYEIKS